MRHSEPDDLKGRVDTVRQGCRMVACLAAFERHDTEPNKRKEPK